MSPFVGLPLMLLGAHMALAQTVMTGLTGAGTSRLFPADAAALEPGESKSSLGCAVRPSGPELGFDFIFHVRFEVAVKLRDLAGDGNLLTAIFRVVPDGRAEAAVYFQQKWRVPALPEDAAGATSLESAFSVGEGDYAVDWMMRDLHERVCSAHWRISAKSPIRRGSFPAGLPPGSAAAAGTGMSPEPETPADGPDRRIAVAVLLNLSPPRASSAKIPPEQREALLAILRSITREPRIGTISLTAFHLAHRQVIFQQDNIRPIHLENHKQAIDSLSLGTVDIAQLLEKDAEARFLAGVAAGETQRTRPDALIFVGPRTVDEAEMTRDLTKELRDARLPVFYLTYAPTPEANPWGDLIGSAVRQWRGREFSITKPLDLVSAWSKIMTDLRHADSIETRGR